MNMTRAILERVQEVELEITPEFQKRGDREASTWDMHDAFSDNGWVLKKHQQKGDTVMYTYEHPGIPGATMSYMYSAHSGKVVGQMFVQAGEDAEPHRFEPDPNMVKKITNDWLGIAAKAAGEKKVWPVSEALDIVVVTDMITQIGWGILSDTVFFGGAGRKARVFKNLKVKKKIRVTYDPKTGNIVNALVLSHDDGVLEALDTAPGNIYKAAQAFMKEAGA